MMIQHALQDAAGLYVVGGAVRDLLLGYIPKDVDIIVRGLTLNQIKERVGRIGKAKEVSKSFGIVKADVGGEEYDLALPRIKEVAGETGTHTDFDVETDPWAEIGDDLQRRDFTINAIAMDLSDFIDVVENGLSNVDGIQELVDLYGADPFNGVSDLKAKVIRAVGNPEKRFMEDKLRMLRALQFAARLNFAIALPTLNAIKKFVWMLNPSERYVSGERILMEIEKVFIKAPHNMNYFIFLIETVKAGRTIFGEDFLPDSIDLSPYLNILKASEIIQIQMAAFFHDGGDYKLMKPAREIERIIELSSFILEHELPKVPYPYEWFNLGDRKFLPLLAILFNEIGQSEYKDLVLEMENLALLPKELPISGEDLMKAGYKGIEIGVEQKRMLRNVWDNRITK